MPVLNITQSRLRMCWSLHEATTPERSAKIFSSLLCRLDRAMPSVGLLPHCFVGGMLMADYALLRFAGAHERFTQGHVRSAQAHNRSV